MGCTEKYIAFSCSQMLGSTAVDCRATFRCCHLMTCGIYIQQSLGWCGKDIQTPRYQQSYDKPYFFSGIMHPAKPLPEEFKPFLQWANSLGYGQFNMTLINYYRDASDYIGNIV